MFLVCASVSFYFLTLYYVFLIINRILELGYGKAIEEILDFLGSRKDDSTSREKGERPHNISRQNLLLSATLNDKVNHLANVSLVNPVKIGLDDKKISSNQPNPSVRKFSAIDSDEDEDLRSLDALPSHSTENYNLPSQLVQRYAKGKCLTVVKYFRFPKWLLEHVA